MKLTLKKSYARRLRYVVIGLIGWLLMVSIGQSVAAKGILAGVGKVDITDREAGPVNDPLFVKALALKTETTTLVIVTLDAVAVGEIGRIPNDYLSEVRSRIHQELGVAPNCVLVNASHCHGVVRGDVDDRTFLAVETALQNLTPVRLGVGVGHEDRIMENRRLKLKNGQEADVRHAYALPLDDEVAEVGPIDPQIGVIRIERLDGRLLAVVYNFACHPIQGVPSGANTADIIGFASKVIEETSNDDTLALFLQGCGGDINPIFYKDVEHPRSAEPLGNMLGLSVMRALREIPCGDDDRLAVISDSLELPRGDRSERLFALEAEQKRLVQGLKGTSLNFKTFLPMVVKYDVAAEFPSYYSHRYLHDDKLGRDDFRKLDAENRRNMQHYIDNIRIMEQLTRVQTNLELLRKHQATFLASGKRTVDVEIAAVRIGKCVITTFPGELTVQIGLNIKRDSPHERTFVAAYTNGYIYYAPTSEQLMNPGTAQEDCDCILAPEWQQIYEQRVRELLEKI